MARASLRLFFALVVFGLVIGFITLRDLYDSTSTYTLKGGLLPYKDTLQNVFNFPSSVYIEKTEGGETKRIVSNYNLRNMGPAESNEELEFLLNIRKLIVYSVHELNKPFRFTSCIKWWANPLDLISYEELSKSDTHTFQEIKFRVQPGNIRYKATIKQKHPPIDVNDDELEIMGGLEPLDHFKLESCNGTEKIDEKVRRNCLCSTSADLVEMEKLTAELMKSWDLVDKELVTWPPNLSFSIPDYMNYTDYDSFITSPGKEEVNLIGYSTEFCGPDIKMLVMISSAPGHFTQRKNIRNTFASPENLKGKGIKVVFLMGIPKNETMNEQIHQEAGESKDIIQGSFMDSYHNLTVSHLSMYKWAHLSCIQGKDKGITVPQFILKADDDFLLNVDLALKVAQSNTDVEYIGCLFCGTKIIRNIAYMHKYYTPRYMHISGSYAGYLSGVVYLLRTDAIPRLLHMSITTPMIHMDDAYVTGILLRRLQIYPRGSNLFTYGRTEPDACKTKTMASSYVLNPDDMLVQWKKFIEPAPKNCSLDDLPLKVRALDEGTKRVCFYS